MLLVEIMSFHRIMRQAFHGPMHGGLWCGKIYSGEIRRLPLPLDFQCPISIRPTMEKVHLVFVKAKTKASVQGFFATLKLSPVQPFSPSG